MVVYYRYRDNDKKYSNSSSKLLAFLYDNRLGNFILPLIIKPSVSNLVGKYLNSKYSKSMINNFIKKNNIDLSLYEDKDYISFNDFFMRQKKHKYLKIGTEFISPCDSKLLVYKIGSNSIFDIKGHSYSVNDLINKDISSLYKNGYALVFRLEANNYHRYCYIDDGTKDKNIHINGVFHTVQDVALNKYSVYKENSREYTILHTKNYDDIVDIEVGALLVGKIVNKDDTDIVKGNEKGHFEFGGSTIVLLVKDKKIDIDSDIMNNSINGIETVVKYGENIAKKSR